MVDQVHTIHRDKREKKYIFILLLISILFLSIKRHNDKTYDNKRWEVN